MVRRVVAQSARRGHSARQCRVAGDEVPGEEETRPDPLPGQCRQDRVHAVTIGPGVLARLVGFDEVGALVVLARVIDVVPGVAVDVAVDVRPAAEEVAMLVTVGDVLGPALGVCGEEAKAAASSSAETAKAMTRI